jgi:hypothetical protein
MSFTNTKANVFKKYLSRLNMATGCRCDSCNCTSKPVKACGCDENSECSSCPKKENDDLEKRDGVFCRKCKEFLPMAEPDKVGDGKCLCWKCAH